MLVGPGDGAGTVLIGAAAADGKILYGDVSALTVGVALCMSSGCIRKGENASVIKNNPNVAMPKQRALSN